MPAPNEAILGEWIIQDSDNTSTYPDGNVASIGWNESTQKYNLTWTTGAGNTYTMHQLVYSEPGGVPTIQGTLVSEFCATFTLDENENPPLLSADIVDGACSPLNAATIEPPFAEEDTLAGTWSSNERPS
jgi:hypothetical protein